jgi:hypothetical protein
MSLYALASAGAFSLLVSTPTVNELLSDEPATIVGRTSSLCRIHALPSAIVGVIDVLEHGGRFLLEQLRRVRLR